MRKRILIQSTVNLKNHLELQEHLKPLIISGD